MKLHHPVGQVVTFPKLQVGLSEIPLCGHATLAGAHILFEIGMADPGGTIFLKAEGADPEIEKDASWIVMNFPSYPLKRTDIPEDFKEIIGFEPAGVFSSIYSLIVAVGNSEKEIREANPGFNKMEDKGLGHLVITAESDLKGCDRVLRCFAPSLGINEDPVTGSVVH